MRKSKAAQAVVRPKIELLSEAVVEHTLAFKLIVRDFMTVENGIAYPTVFERNVGPKTKEALVAVLAALDVVLAMQGALHIEQAKLDALVPARRVQRLKGLTPRAGSWLNYGRVFKTKPVAEALAKKLLSGNDRGVWDYRVVPATTPSGNA